MLPTTLLSHLQLLLRLEDQYQHDCQQEPDWLHRRDRQLASQLPAEPTVKQLQAWLQQVGSTASSELTLQLYRGLQWLSLLGFVFGILSMSALLAYDGSSRLNILLLLGFIAAQLLLTLMASYASVKPPTLPPLFASGRLLSWLMPAYPQLGPHSARLVMLASHYFSCLFSLGALLCFLVTLSLQDLAFGWSTTLQWHSEEFAQLLHYLAWPWARWLPEALPSLDLISASQFYRIEQTSITDPSVLGGWWPYLVMSWISYALLPRLLLLLASLLLCQRSLQQQLLQHPAAQGLQQRLNTPWVESSNQARQDYQAPASHMMAIHTALPSEVQYLHWGDAGYPQLELSQLPKASQQLRAGGHHALQQDQRALEALDTNPLMIVCKAWEPPLGELSDFIQQALTQVPAVWLLPLNEQQQPAALPLESWQLFVQRQQPAAVYLYQVESLP